MSRRSTTSNTTAVWPLLALFMAGVLIPTGCVLWLLQAAVSNERLAVREKLLLVYAAKLDDAPDMAEAFFKGWSTKPGGAPDQRSAGERFAALAMDTAADSVVVLSQGVPIYPDTAEPDMARLPATPPWRQAAQLEFQLGRPAEAAARYRALADGDGADAASRVLALQAGARCLEKSGDREGALQLLEALLDDPAFRDAQDDSGRLVALPGMLRCLELAGENTARFEKARGVLARRLARYDGAPIPSAQRRFLLRRLVEIAPDDALTALLHAESLAARIVDDLPALPETGRLGPAGGDLWIWLLAERDALLLFETASLRDRIEELVRPRFAGTGAAPELVPPNTPMDGGAVLLREDAGEALPGWRWALRFEGEDPFAVAAERQVLVYGWTALLVLIAAVAFTALATRRVVQHLREAQMKNELIAVVSHELKTPLASMRALVDTMREGRCTAPEQQAEYLRLIAAENERLTHLIDNFLSFSRPDRAGLNLSMKATDLGALAAACAENLRDRLDAAGFTLEVDIAPDLPIVRADAGALQTVLQNLVENAIKYSDTQQRHIRIGVRQRDNTVEIAVADQGIGMSKEEIRQAFDRFYQADRNLNRRTGGCGLGLSIVKSIVDAHGGRVSVESAPGKGSVFAVHLPAAEVKGSAR